MSAGRLRNVMQRLRRAAGAPAAGGLTDAELLRRWVAQRDEAAFEALLWRHTAAVLGVCRRVLRDAHEAEDAAQAAFLTLAHKARSIGRRQAVAAWLYTVAYRVALRARTRRPALAPYDLSALPARPAEDPAWRDLRPVLDEEVSRLPERYRAAFVLCHVEGRTNEEAARELGCPVGTVLSRLARARERLRRRLTGRGVTLTAGALAAAAVGESVAGAAPGVLVRTAVAAAVLAAAGKGLTGVVSTEVVALAEGVMKAMLLTKVKAVAVVVLGLALLGGGGALSYRTVAGEPGAPPKDPAALAQTAKAPQGEQDKLKAQLAQKEKEIEALKERLAVTERDLRDKMSQLEDALKKEQDALKKERQQAERAVAAEREARARAEAERDARVVAEKLAEDRAVRKAAEPAEGGDKVGDPNRTASRAERAEQAREEVELLEAQVVGKRAQLDATTISLKATQEAAAAGAANATRVEVAALTGQVRVREAELKEAEIRLAQAKRRLAKLDGPAAPATDAQHQQMGQRAAELEKKFDALKKELDGLRKELEQPRSRQH
jgi:RNA polymerase sigma factor (sigma-70 family)